MPKKTPKPEPVTLTSFTDAQLQAELKSREAARKKAAEEAHAAKWERLRFLVQDSTFGEAVVNAIAPEHDYTSCSDETLSNIERPCSRCVLLATAKESYTPEFEMDFKFTVFTKEGF